MYDGNAFGEAEAAPTAAAADGPKRRQRACKVCSLMKGSKKPHTTAYYCAECDEKTHIYLCMQPRDVFRGALTNRFDVWHKEWSAGKLIPTNQDRSIRMRPTKDGGARKRQTSSTD
ncbi:hypothetical protein C6341_g16304 [Phytophthora cactorum]|nr:hypothetical protein C6341_g16304 [Phytophthora cactorum]